MLIICIRQGLIMELTICLPRDYCLGSMGMCPLGGLTLGNPSVSRKSVEKRPKEQATSLDDRAWGYSRFIM